MISNSTTWRWCYNTDIKLSHKYTFTQNDKKVAETFNNFFENGVSCLKLSKN